MREPFVGREVELGVLSEALERALKYRAPQAVTVLGPLGVGKTRLVEEWLGAALPAEARLVRARAEATRAPRGLLAALLRDRFQLDGAPDEGEALDWFRAELQRVFGDRRIAEVAALLGDFLGFDLPESPLLRALAGKTEQGADLARAVLCRFLERDALDRPLVILAEDLHAADDESLALLESLVGELGEAPILVVATSRPDLLVRRPSWGAAAGAAAWARVELAPLAHDEAVALASELVEPDALPPALIERAAVESGGNPFLVRQLVDVYRSHGARAAETGEGEWLDLERADAERLALTGEDAAALRAAALTPAERDVLERGAVFGSVFWTGGVVALGRFGAAPADDASIFAPDPAIAEIRQLLNGLVERDYLVRLPESVLPGEEAWGFRHALEQTLIAAAVEPEVARRRTVFAAQWLESRGGPAREQRLEPLARLYEAGGDARRAAYCYVTAAADARGHRLLERAHVLYVAGVRLLGLEDAVAKMDALYAAGDLSARLGYTHEALAHFGEMLRLAWRLDLPAKGGAAHGRIGRLHGTLGAYAQARAHLERARQLFEVAGDLPGVAAALDDMGRIHFLGGASDASLSCHRAALALRERLGDDRGRALTLARLGQVEHEAGDLTGAGAHFREALALRRRVGDRQGEVASLLDLGALEIDLGQMDAAKARLGEGRALARDLGERLFEASFAIELGECHLAEGHPRLALEELEDARELGRQFGARGLLSEATRGAAEAALALGDLRRARDDARRAFDLATRVGSAALEGAALRVLAAAVGMGAPGEAELGGAREMFDRAVEVLSNAGAEIELGRALASYADFESRAGRRDAARELAHQAALIRVRSRRPPNEPSVSSFSQTPLG
ncbi:MAG TPA: AAA family ATPase [Polyangia bacterium]|nr:AAA family ATPase [Polyangia bacterium]